VDCEDAANSTATITHHGECPTMAAPPVAMVVAAAFGIGLEPENFSQRSAAGDCKTIVSHVYM